LRIKEVNARKILNSVGNYSIEIKIETELGAFKASVPKGTSVGKHEVKDYAGGITTAVKNVNKKVKPLLKKIRITVLQDILDFESKTEKLGGHVVLAISYVLLKALAAEKKIAVWQIFNKNKKMPQLLNKIIGGGKHTGKNAATFQEFLVLQDFKNIEKNLALHKEVGEWWGFWGKDLEGGWVINASDEKVLEIIRKFGKDAEIGVDVAASSFYEDGRYIYKNVSPFTKDGMIFLPKLSKEKIQQIAHIKKLQENYNIYYIEDPLEEEDFKGFAELTQQIGKNTLIVGDDLFVTNPERLKKGIQLGACNACIVKPDQIGSLAKTIEFVQLAKKHNYTTIISHRSGETNEDIIADLAVGLQIPIIKIGLVGGERVAKLNRLFEIEGE
jgi:enolase